MEKALFKFIGKIFKIKIVPLNNESPEEIAKKISLPLLKALKETQKERQSECP